MKILILAFFVVSCAQTKKTIPKHLVFIPGSHSDGKIWSSVKKSMDPKAFNMMDLGRLGRDTIQAASLKHMAELSCDAIPQNSILVAHSFGGAISNQMVGVCPEKISKIIYVSGIVPLQGEKPFDLMNKTDETNYAKAVTFGKFKIIPKASNTYFSVTDPYIKSSTELPMLYSEWLSPGDEMIKYDQATFEAIPKAYIFTEKDSIVGLTTQFQYTSRAGIKDSDGIPTGHYPMLSNPDRLAFLITKWAR